MDYAENGSLSKYDVFDIADASEWEGDAELFVNSLVISGFVDDTEHGLEIHDWMAYIGKLVSTREKDRERKRNSREKTKTPDGSPKESQQTSNALPEDGQRNSYGQEGGFQQMSYGQADEFQQMSYGSPADIQRTGTGQAQDISRTADGRRTDGGRNQPTNSNQPTVTKRERETAAETAAPLTPPGDRLFFGEFGNVLLTEDEKRKLEQRLGLPCTADYIEQLSSYIAASNKDYKSHYATILRWWRRDNSTTTPKLEQRQGRSPSRYKRQFQVGSVSTIQETPEERRARYAQLER